MGHIDQGRAFHVVICVALSAAELWRDNCKEEALVESNLRESEVFSEVIRDTRLTHAILERAPGTIVSLVPAHGDSRVGAVAEQLSRTLTEDLGVSVLLADFDASGYPPWTFMWTTNEAPRRLDGRTWGAFVTEVDGLDILDARETHPRQLGRLLDHARRKYSAICADLTGAREPHTLEVLRVSDAIFLVTDSDRASLEGAREKAGWLRSIDLDDRVGLLVRHSPGGPGTDEIEDITGLPVCSLIETDAQMTRFARWLASQSSAPEIDAAYSLAG
jgi:Flp pilus assembly CpaE family ATPase